MARLSGLQREVLSLYRNCLREIRKKPVVSSPPSAFSPSAGNCYRQVTLTIHAFRRTQESRSNFKYYARYARSPT
ncbi:hypothetical protein BJY01DRAFT_112965 [Aspergillus pseudoustus]|uniref:Mitochondrial zinc maintenance protein 1, mitochondrial n=1 Tax=Aspergillus pseudoustus TaxID=1810923 RepID=A0ABR4L2J5_9EURO